jgi:hypothetical protein
MREVTAQWMPIFISKNKLIGIQYFDIELNRYAGNKVLGIGISQIAYKNESSAHSMEGTILLWLHENNGVWSEKRVRDTSFIVKEGETLRVLVDLINYTIVWERIQPSYHKIISYDIPEDIRCLDFYPFMEITSGFSGTVTLL